MKKHRTHQTDEDAQNVFMPSMPLAWGKNELTKNDYGKDYLIEIGDADGEQTGNSFYVQLKGQEKSRLNRAKTAVCFGLKKKHALYFADKIKDLPIFLVIVNVNERIARYLFLQPALTDNQQWRGKGSLTLEIPLENKVEDHAAFRQAIEDAKKWLRVNHAASIADAIEAYKQRIIKTDPRFTPKVSVKDDGKIEALLLANEPVELTVEIKGDKDAIQKKITELIDEGSMVSFESGEIKILGSDLFANFGKEGGALQCSVTLNGTCTLDSTDSEGRKLGTLPDIPGLVTGGQKVKWFEGGYPNSPLKIKLGPIAVGAGGATNLKLSFLQWDGQHLLQLAHFDRIYAFFRVVAKSTISMASIQIDGNDFFSVTLPLAAQDHLDYLTQYLDSIHKARLVAKHFGINPVWKTRAFDEDEIETAQQLYGVFFEGGWTKPRPRCRLAFSCERQGFNWAPTKAWGKPTDLRYITEWTFTLLGEHVTTQELVADFRQGMMSIDDNYKSNGSPKKRSATKKPVKRNSSEDIRLVFKGTPATIMEMHLPTPKDE